MQTVNDIRSAFLTYFAEEGHAILPSSPLVPRNDPTLLFTNAGMVQFKNVFTGAERRDYARATTSQKCVRAGGKHNDLENVGYTARHHTFFEMLGNFSFGDYFKERAIELAWTLVTKRLGLAADRLLVTVYAEDEEAAGLWRRIAGLDDRRIIRIATSDNFWAMGETGPCGPCSEIFYDHGDHIPGGPPGSPGEDGDRFIEIWNLVFMQFEQVSAAERVSLPRPSIDTGMGLERIAAVLQGVHDNYDIDLFRSLIAASVDATGVPADGAQGVSHRVIADHLRAASFLIADGVLPAKEGRGYVLRRIMRRAMRHGQLLGAREPLLWKLVPALTAQMGAAYPELVRAEPLIRETLRLEETGFRETLERGLRLLGDEVGKLPGSAALSGAVAFKLYDTYGFPLDLTQDVLRGQGLTVETGGFDRAMEQQRADARRHWAGSGEAATDRFWLDLRERLGATEFLGYETERAEGLVTALLVEGEEVASVGPGTTASVVLNQTPFYGESGGQMGDTGALTTAGGARLTVTDTARKAGDLFIHTGTLDGGSLAVGDAVELAVDHQRRSRLRSNHSATHLLHEALRQRLGAHVTQKGSLVAPDRLRFDFSHGQPIAPADLERIEAAVNDRIRDNSPVTTRLMTPDAAVAEGAMALFGEKYGEIVRVVSMGGAAEAGSGRSAWSVELCGGTHVPQTGAIGHLRILSESAVAAGVRRVEALTGGDAEAYERQQAALLRDSAQLLKTAPAELPQRLAGLIEDRRRLERELTEARRKLATGGAAASDLKEIAGIRFSGRIVDDVPARELKGLADSIKEQMGSGVVAIAAKIDGKASLVVAVTADLAGAGGVSAIDLVRVGAAALGGSGGGGRPDMAQAGGPAGDAGPAAIAAIEAALASRAAAS